MRLQGSRTANADLLVFSRRAVLATVLAPMSFVAPKHAVCAAPEPPLTAVPQRQRFEVTFEYLPVSRSEVPGMRRVQVPVEIQTPATQPGQFDTGPPVVIFSPGFLQSAASYGTFLAQLLAAGLVVVTYDKSFEELSSLVDDIDSAQLLARVRAEVASRLGEPGAGPCFLAGHSRGGKLSVLAAAERTSPQPPPLPSGLQAAEVGAIAGRGAAVSMLPYQPPPSYPVSGLVLLDPADGAFEPQDPGRYPSALPLLRNQTELADVPVLLLGAGRGGDCVPKAKSYSAFFAACRGPCALVTLKDAGHLQFLDASDSLTRSICATGRGVANTQVAAASGRLAADFIRGVAAGAAAAGGGGGGQAAAPGGASAAALERLCREGLGGVGLRYEVQVSGGGEAG
ncbi:hypothetical protein PLESTF_000598900 [Pleodorina starrii]|nr:hypothetical protein PLESTM_001772200 [Pleodorina starrii]GLC67724.1 hypothetical protein PLESTF_000598900 [Pleodorina starrii]